MNEVVEKAEAEAVKLFDAIDKNHDGSITLKELGAFVKRNPEGLSALAEQVSLTP